MQSFINYIVSFVRQIFSAVSTAINAAPSSVQPYQNWLNKDIISGDLIKIGITWSEFLVYGIIWFLIIFFIVLIFKIVFKVIGLFRI